MVIAIVLFAIMFAGLFWIYKNPEDSLLWGMRNMFKEQPQLTEETILRQKKKALYGMLFLGYMAVIAILLLMIQDSVRFL